MRGGLEQQYGLILKCLSSGYMLNGWSLHGAFNYLLDIMQFACFYCLCSLSLTCIHCIIVVCTNVSSCVYSANCTVHNYLIGLHCSVCNRMFRMSFTETACTQQPVTILTAKLLPENRRKGVSFLVHSCWFILSMSRSQRLCELL